MNKKTVVLGVASALTLGTVSIVSANMNSNSSTNPTKLAISKSATVAPTTTPSATKETTNITPVSTQPTGQSTAATPIQKPIVSQSDQNKAQLQAVVTAKTTTMINALGLPSQLIDIQWACVDKLVTATVGYSDYDAAANVDAVKFILGQSDTATSYSYFQDRGTCKVITAPIQP